METPQADTKRITAVRAKLLPEIKDAFKQIGVDKLRVRIGDTIKEKQKKAQDEVVAEALAKAKADSEAQAKASADATLMGRLFG